MKYPRIRYSFVLAGVLFAWPSVGINSAVAAGPEAINSITGTGIGVILIAVAVALLLTLVLHTTGSYFASQISEKIGRHRILRTLRSKSHYVLEDCIISGVYDGLTRIDYAVLTAGGIVCIRMKHCSGMIFGGTDDPQWTNVDGIHRNKFLNPQIQNEGRRKALQKIVPDIPIVNLIVFSGSAKLTSVPEKNVIHSRDLGRYIEKFSSHPCDSVDWNSTWLSLNSAILDDEESRKDFQAQLNFS